MKKYDIVELKNDEPYKELNLTKGTIGTVIESKKGFSKVIFTNPKNMGQYLITEVNNWDVIPINEALPLSYQKEFIENYDIILKNAVEKFPIQKVKEFDWVKLNVEKPKYAKEGIHKGEIGCVMDDNAVLNCVEVDFINSNFSISIDMDDLEVIKKSEDK